MSNDVLETAEQKEDGLIGREHDRFREP